MREKFVFRQKSLNKHFTFFVCEMADMGEELKNALCSSKVREVEEGIRQHRNGERELWKMKWFINDLRGNEDVGLQNIFHLEFIAPTFRTNRFTVEPHNIRFCINFSNFFFKPLSAEAKRFQFCIPAGIAEIGYWFFDSAPMTLKFGFAVDGERRRALFAPENLAAIAAEERRGFSGAV